MPRARRQAGGGGGGWERFTRCNRKRRIELSSMRRAGRVLFYLGRRA
jgi:hypothetical protein